MNAGCQRNDFVEGRHFDGSRYTLCEIPLSLSRVVGGQDCTGATVKPALTANSSLL
jgi:hypothetical protein